MFVSTKDIFVFYLYIMLSHLLTDLELKSEKNYFLYPPVS